MMMKAVIDIGSNSVRLAIFADGHVFFNGKITTQLGRGLAVDGNILPSQSKKTVDAISVFKEKALLSGVKEENVYAFATATVRRAKNAYNFVNDVFLSTGIKVDVVSEETEADLALTGCLGDKDGAVLDIGGGSSELIVRKNGEVVYSHSLPLGAVVLTDMFGGDKGAMQAYLLGKVAEYGQVPHIDELTGVGGTTSCCARVVARIKGVRPDFCKGFVLKKEEITSLSEEFFSSGDEEKIAMGVEPSRVGIIAAGTLLLKNILSYLGLERVTASENDNLKGYYVLKLKGDADEG